MSKNKHKAYRYGLSAERLASWYLRLKLYRIVAVRYRNHGGEIDIVARRGSTLVAVEVKARRSLAECHDSIDIFKQQKIARAMEGLLASKIAGLGARAPDNIRFDAVWVARGRLPVHIKDAWRM